VVDINAYPYLITKNKTTGKYGLIDAEENIIADEVFKEITPEYFGKKEYIYLTKNNKTTVFNKKDRQLYPNSFIYLNPLFGNLFSTYNEKSKNPGLLICRGILLVLRNMIISGVLAFPEEILSTLKRK
jgi:hypothetical protein